MITLPFGKIDLVFMLLPRRLLLVWMIVSVVDGFVDVFLRGFVVHVMAVTVVAGCGRWICVCVPWMYCTWVRLVL